MILKFHTSLYFEFRLVFFRAIGGEITSDGDFLIFEGNRYSRKGFLYKNFLMSAILSEGVKPTLAELERFEEQPEGMHTFRIAIECHNEMKNLIDSLVI